MLAINDGQLIIKKRQILKDINVRFEEGKVYNLVGANGSGKTMLLKTLAGLVRLSEGNLVYNERILKREFLPNCGIIIEKHQFIDHLTGLENMKLLADIKKVATIEDIKYYMTYFGLNPDDKRKVKVYSLGMLQKLSLVQAFMESPDVLLLDEPTNALDEEYIQKFQKLIIKCREEKKIIIISTHDKFLLDKIADEQILIREGILYPSEIEGN
ncbi:MAG: ABC transporter ATP-binding protein [Turicibacter sp.]|nr:ABC transporter ATP-binding protein [Turicibacter sp.]MDO5794096.1 ABC transporter ATP-binding protein [Turicibacter sp.]CUQ24658.1 Fluoroquinolones export ATP-binding protein Rv2688c/MT2762 [Turicibacter sanguinis]